MESCSETFVRVVIMHTEHTIVAFLKNLKYKVQYQLMHRVMQISMMIISPSMIESPSIELIQH